MVVGNLGHKPTWSQDNMTIRQANLPYKVIRHPVVFKNVLAPHNINIHNF